MSFMKHIKSSPYKTWAVILIAMWLWTISPSSIAGNMNPVVSNFEFIAVADIERSDWSIISGKFYKHRNNCRPLRIEWFLGERSQVRVAVEYVWGRPQIRADGDHVFYNWAVRAAPPEVLHSDTYADVVHKCGFWAGSPHPEKLGAYFEFPWETKTMIWN